MRLLPVPVQSAAPAWRCRLAAADPDARRADETHRESRLAMFADLADRAPRPLADPKIPRPDPPSGQFLAVSHWRWACLHGATYAFSLDCRTEPYQDKRCSR